MKILNKLPITIAIVAALSSTSTFADSWVITQETDLSNETGTNSTITQTGTTTSSYQALNHINLDTTDGTINTGSTQNVITAKPLILKQIDDTTLSHQAANRASAYAITELEQTVSADAGTGTITLEQNDAVATNVQALNDAKTTADTGIIDDLTQTLSAADITTIELNQGNVTATGDNNRQAVNRVESDDVKGLTQKITDSDNITLEMNQGEAPGGIQAGNLIETKGSIAATDVTQDVTVKEASMDQTDSENSIQAANAVSVGDGGNTLGLGGAIAQTFTPYKLSMVQTNATGSIQSGNYIGVALTP